MNENTAKSTNNDGSAYGRKVGQADPVLSQVGAGTPCGEYLRRFWHPVALSSDATVQPKKLRILGEDLVLFRDGLGRAGLLYPHCMHRGTSLYYGKVEDQGIRCCYHGWLFNVQGECLQQPCEPNGGLHRDNARQPWYPVQEKYGLIFAYMGPPEKTPVLPGYENLETLLPGEMYEADNSGFGGFADANAPSVVSYNWLQDYENVMDPFHVQVLHSTFSGIQFAKGFEVMPRVEWEYSDSGMIYRAYREFQDGRKLCRINTLFVPNVAVISEVDLTEGPSRRVGWYVPVDDHNHTTFWVTKVRELGKTYRGLAMHNGKYWSELSEEERRNFPGDFEAQSSQGPVPRHSEWHLKTSDRGVAMVQRLLRGEIGKVSKGEDPMGVSFDPKSATHAVKSGNYYV